MKKSQSQQSILLAPTVRQHETWKTDISHIDCTNADLVAPSADTWQTDLEFLEANVAYRWQALGRTRGVRADYVVHS
jgi:hypothetical protein